METLQEYKAKKEDLAMSLRQWLTYIGWVLTLVFSVVYLIILVIVIFGFTANLDKNDMLLVTAIGALFTFAITMSMMYQGILYAKNQKDVAEVLKAYNGIKYQKVKEKKLKTINSYVVKQVIVNLFGKAAMVGFVSYAVVSLVITGLKDTMLLWLGVANIFMAIGLGMLSLVKSYDAYIEDHVPAIQAKMKFLQETKPDGANTIKEKEAQDAKNQQCGVPHSPSTSEQKQERHPSEYLRN